MNAKSIHVRRTSLTRHLAGALLLALGCAGPDPISPIGPGSYRLATYGDQALPALSTNASGYTVEVMSEQLALLPNRSFTLTRTIRITDDGAVSLVTYERGGEVRQDRNTVFLVYSEDPESPAELAILDGGQRLRGGLNGPSTRELV